MPQLSIWEKESFFAPQDIIIVGSGFVGLWSALQLKTLHPLLHITIIDKGSIPTGASTRNAGFSCFGSPTELIRDNLIMGEDKMLQLVEMRYKGLEEIYIHFNKASIDYMDEGGYECLDSPNDRNEIKGQLTWLNKALYGIIKKENIFNIADEKLAAFGLTGFAHLIENRLEAGLHPGKLVKALLQKLQSMGVQVLTGIEITSFEEKNSLVDLQVSIQGNILSNYHLQAKQLLLCTNAFTKELVPAIDIVPARGQVLVTAPIPGLKLRGNFHFDQGFYYFRNVGTRILLGGGRNKSIEAETTTEMQTTDLIQADLENFLSQHILEGMEYQITDRWSGIMAMGSEKLPIVKAISGKVFCCVRMSGMGVALAPLVAKQIAALMSK